MVWVHGCSYTVALLFSLCISSLSSFIRASSWVCLEVLVSERAEVILHFSLARKKWSWKKRLAWNVELFTTCLFLFFLHSFLCYIATLYLPVAKRNTWIKHLQVGVSCAVVLSGWVCPMKGGLSPRCGWPEFESRPRNIFFFSSEHLPHMSSTPTPLRLLSIFK